MPPKVTSPLPDRSEIIECGVEDDIDKLFQAIDVRTKGPVRSGLRISNSESLKQALRGLSISQASNMAAAKKRSSRPSVNSPGVTEKCEQSKIAEKVPIVPVLDEGSIDAREDKTQSEPLWLSNDVKHSREKAIDLSKHRLRSRNFAKKIMPRVSGINVQTPGPQSFSNTKSAVVRGDERSRSSEKEEISQSWKSSIGEFSSSSTSHSEESSSLGGLHSGRRRCRSGCIWEAWKGCV